MTAVNSKLRAIAYLLILGASFVDPASAQTLQEVLRIAYDTNPTIQAERARQGATSEATAQAWADLLPSIVASGSYEKIDNNQTIDASIFDPTDPGPTPVPNSVQLSTLAAQVEGELVIFDGLRNVNALRQASARVRAGGAQLAATEQDVLLRTATAFFDVVRDAAVYEANLNNVKVLVRQKDQAQLRFDVGEVTRTDVAQADARLAAARAQLTNVQAALNVSRVRFAQLVGDRPGSLESDPAMPDTPDSLLQAIEIGRNFSPRALSARAQEEASRKGVAIAKSAFSPSVSAVTSYRYADQPSNFVLDDETFSYGVRASVPIFLGGLRLSRVREAKSLHDADRRRIVEAERFVEAEIAQGWEQLVAARANIASAESQVAANDLALQGVRREAQLGARTTLDVLNAEQEALNAKVSLADAKRNAQVAVFSLLAAMGILVIDTPLN